MNLEHSSKEQGYLKTLKTVLGISFPVKFHSNMKAYYRSSTGKLKKDDGYFYTKLTQVTTVESRKQLGRCINFSIKIFQTISVLFKILLNSIVCFLHISSSYFLVRGIIKVEVFS